MENNKQNTVLLTIIAVATLLVAVVGATFAYFTANQNTGSTAQVLTNSGKMNITFADGTDVVTLDKYKNGFEPSQDILVDKTFTITGDNITKAKSAVVPAKGTENATYTDVTSPNMPFIVNLDYTTTFISNELHILIKQVSAESDFIEKVSYKGTVLADSDKAPDELKGINSLTGYYDYAVGSGTADNKESKGTLELAYGEFKETTDSTGNENQIQFRVVFVFPDTGDQQDYNKEATFAGILKVTTTENGAPRA